MKPCGYKPRNVRHIHHEYRAHLVGYFTEPGKIDCSRISAGAGDNQLGLALVSGFSQLIVIYPAIRPAHAVRNDIEIVARNVDGTAVRQMSAVREIHAEYCVARS